MKCIYNIYNALGDFTYCGQPESFPLISAKEYWKYIKYDADCVTCLNILYQNCNEKSITPCLKKIDNRIKLVLKIEQFKKDFDFIL